MPSADNVIAIDSLTRRFGRKSALDNVSLSVPRGVVVGLIGLNGAGKTTLIKHVLGLYRAMSGSVRVFGVDPVQDPTSVLSRVGYLGENVDLPDWMRVEELMNYTRAFFPRWDPSLAEELRKRFGLDLRDRIGTLSKGQRARAGLLAALAHRPELLVLDEPSSGLDPLVRREVLGAVVRTIADEGRTVVFSSHLLGEVERVSDQLAMMHDGKIVLSGPLDDIKANHRWYTIRMSAALSAAPNWPGALAWEGNGMEWRALCNGRADELRSAIERHGARIVDEGTPNLEEVFVARAGRPTEEVPS